MALRDRRMCKRAHPRHLTLKITVARYEQIYGAQSGLSASFIEGVKNF